MYDLNSRHRRMDTRPYFGREDGAEMVAVQNRFPDKDGVGGSWPLLAAAGSWHVVPSVPWCVWQCLPVLGERFCGGVRVAPAADPQI